MYMWKKAHPNTELRVQAVHIMHVETSWQTLERSLPIMVDVLQGFEAYSKGIDNDRDTETPE